MELIGLLLLALVPQILCTKIGFDSSDISQSNSSQNDLITNTQQKFKASDLQSVFADISCNKCIKCMERAITAHKITNSVMQMKNTDVLNHLNDESHRQKRETGTKIIKKAKTDAVMSVAKYYAYGKLYALKVKENIDSYKTDKCDVYKVEYEYPCNTTKAKLILKRPKIHNMKNKSKGKIELSEQVVNKTKL